MTSRRPSNCAPEPEPLTALRTVASLITMWYSSTRESAGRGGISEQMARNCRDREMSRIGFLAPLFAASLLCIAPAAAQVEGGRAAALDYLGRGTAAFRAGDIVAATRDWSEAIRLCRLNAALAATAQTNAARLALHRNEVAQATALLTRAVDTLERLPPSYSRGMALVSAGSAVFEGEGRIPADTQAVASRAFRAAAESADSLHNATLSSLAQGGLGHLYERENRLEEAASLTDRAAFAAQQASAPELSFRWELQRARRARQRGATDTALTSYSRAVAELQSG